MLTIFVTMLLNYLFLWNLFDILRLDRERFLFLVWDLAWHLGATHFRGYRIYLEALRLWLSLLLHDFARQRRLCIRHLYFKQTSQGFNRAVINWSLPIGVFNVWISSQVQECFSCDLVVEGNSHMQSCASSIITQVNQPSHHLSSCWNRLLIF